GDIRRLVGSEKIDRIIIALNDRRAKLPMSALLDCKLAGVVIEEGETFNERLSGKIPLDHLKPSWMVFSDGFRSLRSRKTVKRVIDVVLSLVCLILTLPIFLITAILIKLDSRGPVIFKQVRVGENGKHFNVYKFRSMRTDAESASGPVWASKKDDRVTRVGRVIRKIRVDELPQVVNVLKGDMSFVGPRPERPFFVDKLKEVIPYYEIRNIVKPGITGWAQIKYPYGATIDDAVEKLQYDIYYIKNLSPMLDIMIFFWTIKVVLTGRGGR
ncbi:MAG TPA: TIGR03013 family XrtA/PEP-CTERM system glycosyltransferase, partial [Thermodesulfobacteriota bacterium]|nr:TIGR03013 family XrtA/PEP-CTERM system glycosyltransferase [Thermodesulfobacteriota bacterium]